MIHGSATRHSEALGDHVAILLSLHNGERWLNSQLDSFLAQTHTHWTLYWRDDDSTDSSRAIMLSFAAHRGNGRCVEIDDTCVSLGVRESYALLVDASPSDSMIAFSDQDDVWHPQKLEWALAKLRMVPDGTPGLYCARQWLTDADLNVIGESARLRHQPDFASGLTQNLATGHTVLLNRDAARLLRGFPPPEGVLHDWWAYLVVLGAGGAFLFDQRCVSHYRQHSRNAVGAQRSFFKRGVNALRRGPQTFMRSFYACVDTLLSRPATLAPTAQALLEDIERAETRRERLSLLRRYPELHRQNRMETAVFRIWYLAGLST